VLILIRTCTRLHPVPPRLILALGLLLAACAGGGDATPTAPGPAAPQPSPTIPPAASPAASAEPPAAATAGVPASGLVLSACHLSAPGSAVRLPAECGTLRVPEDPAAPQGRLIGLRVAVVSSASR
jgi:hypothetical protein